MKTQMKNFIKSCIFYFNYIINVLFNILRYKNNKSLDKKNQSRNEKTSLKKKTDKPSIKKNRRKPTAGRKKKDYSKYPTLKKNKEGEKNV